MRLRLDSIDLDHVQIPLQESLQAGSAEVRVKDSVVLRLQTSRGTGWGEASIPIDPERRGGQTVDACWEDLCDRLGPAVLAEGNVEVEGLADVLNRAAETTCAKAGLEIAVWHAAATARDVPLHVLIGGVARPIPSGLSIDAFPPTVDALLDRVEQYLGDGYRQVKIRIRPDWDIEPVARIRQQWPDLPLVVDAAGSYGPEHIGTFRNLDKYRLAAIEQPLPSDSLSELAQLQTVLDAPICLDVSRMDVSQIREVAKRQAARIASINIQRAGGLTEAMQRREAACKNGLSCWLAATPDLGIGAAAGLHVATLDGFDHPTEVGSANRWFADDLLEPPIVVDAGGYLHLPDGAGFGFRPNREKVEKYTIRYETLTA